MPQYVALLRGIGPTNPAMRNDRLAAALKSLGLKDVHPVLASGNLVFTAPERSTATLETEIEAALTKKLRLDLDVVVRSQAELEALVKRDPFRGKTHGKEWYLTVTFLKGKPKPVFTTLDRAAMDGPEFMADLERRYGKRITTRTWNTIQKIIAKMQAAN